MNKKGFTLIELLAVIIILGILMLVAIPSVTTYINNSRKEAYITTAKNYIKGATNMVNQGDKDFFDPEVTYYIPYKCIALETGGDSPYGKFDKAYVLVTYDNESFEYYWKSRDITGMGVKDAILGNDLKSDKIVAGIKTEEITTDDSIGGRVKTIVMDENTCELGAATDVIREDRIVEEIYHADDTTPHTTGYTVIPEEDFDFTSLPDFPVYCSIDHSLDTTFRESIRYLRVKIFYGFYVYYGQDNYARVKLLYNFPKFRDNSDGSIHTVKQFIARKDEEFYASDGTVYPFSYTCNTTNTTGHIADCVITPTNFEMRKCINDGAANHYYCMNGDQNGTHYMYYVLDNGDMLPAWKAAKYNGAYPLSYTARTGEFRVEVTDLAYTFSETR